VGGSGEKVLQRGEDVLSGEHSALGGIIRNQKTQSGEGKWHPNAVTAKLQKKKEEVGGSH